ncbi:MAG: TRAP transporter small permease, partial [Sulfitobacter sp.]
MSNDKQGVKQERSKFSNGVDAVSHAAGIAGAIALLAMISFVCFEVLSRWLFNEPTVWVNEYASYLLIGITFLGLAYAQKEKGHIQVELILGWLSAQSRLKLQKVTLWIGLFFVVFAAWQMVSFNYQEYINNTRSWGMLATRQWKPQVVVSVGYGLFCLSILADINRTNRPIGSLRW